MQYFFFGGGGFGYFYMRNALNDHLYQKNFFKINNKINYKIKKDSSIFMSNVTFLQSLTIIFKGKNNFHSSNL